MTHEEILTKAIAKATTAGYKPEGITAVTNFKPTIRNGQAWVRWFNDDGQEVIQDLEHIIYNHDFAKALWGEGLYIKPAYEALEPPRDIHPWRYHLIHTVIAADPIKYLGDNL